MNEKPAISPVLPPILAIDDSSDDLLLLKKLLVKSGAKFPLVTFTDANAAVTYLVEAAKIRSDRQLNRMPVFMMSTSDRPDDAKTGKALVVDDDFVKFPGAADIARILASAGDPAPQFDAARQ